jgi:hypothetical protein
MWHEVNRYRISNKSGDTEEMILERHDDGSFRIRNDFGNVSIEFDSLSGAEFLRNVFDDLRDQIELDINDEWDDDDETDPGVI